MYIRHKESQKLCTAGTINISQMQLPEQFADVSRGCGHIQPQFHSVQRDPPHHAPVLRHPGQLHAGRQLRADQQVEQLREWCDHRQI